MTEIILTNAEISILEKIASSVEFDNISNVRNYRGVSDKNKKVLYSILRNYLEPIIGNFNIDEAVLSIMYEPGDIHTDYQYVKNNPHYIILIPLETINAHTVIFNEECLDDFEDFKNQNNKPVNNCVDLYDNLLSNVSKEDLEYVSLSRIEKWTRGKLIMWDMKLLHTSDNFKSQGIEYKKSLIICTSKK